MQKEYVIHISTCRHFDDFVCRLVCLEGVQEAKCEVQLLHGLSHFNIPFVSYEEGLPLLPQDTQYKIKFCLCGLVVRVSGYRYRGLGFDSRRYQIF